jgi:hypothetical protein
VRSATFASRPLRPLSVVERDGGLRGEHSEKIAVGVVEAAEHAVDVRVQIPKQLLLCDQGRDQVRTLVELVCVVGRMAHARRAGPASFVEPRPDHLQQRPSVLAQGHLGADNLSNPHSIRAPAARAPRPRVP